MKPDIDALERLRAEVICPPIEPVEFVPDGDGSTGAIVKPNGYTVVDLADTDFGTYVASLVNAFPALAEEVRALRRVAEAAREYRDTFGVYEGEERLRVDFKILLRASERLDAALDAVPRDWADAAGGREEHRGRRSVPVVRKLQAQPMQMPPARPWAVLLAFQDSTSVYLTQFARREAAESGAAGARQGGSEAIVLEVRELLEWARGKAKGSTS